jgi:hypothetical protein
MVAAGLILILTLNVDVLLRASGCLIWLAFGRFELQRMQLGFDGCVSIHLFPDGQIAVLDIDSEWSRGNLQTGSVVLDNFAWLRLRTDDGRCFAELIRGDARQSHNWRRLQVIWRHIGAGR